jgi:hypothetical protein
VLGAENAAERLNAVDERRRQGGWAALVDAFVRERQREIGED